MTAQNKDSYDIIKHPLSTEKSIRMMEAENKLIFVIDKKATKTEVKAAIEDIFNVKVDKVSTLVTPKGEKRAYVKFNIENPAIDIATQLGLM
jgi:large subunit ribosomal protein L23